MKINLKLGWDVDDADQSKVDIADEIIQEEAERFVRDLRNRLEAQGLDITAFQKSG